MYFERNTLTTLKWCILEKQFDFLNSKEYSNHELHKNKIGLMSNMVYIQDDNNYCRHRNCNDDHSENDDCNGDNNDKTMKWW